MLRVVDWYSGWRNSGGNSFTSDTTRRMETEVSRGGAPRSVATTITSRSSRIRVWRWEGGQDRDKHLIAFPGLPPRLYLAVVEGCEIKSRPGYEVKNAKLS